MTLRKPILCNYILFFIQILTLLTELIVLLFLSREDLFIFLLVNHHQTRHETFIHNILYYFFQTYDFFYYDDQ